ncbi:MAG: UvrD-helicase domain-containing protein, partial [Bacteroidales bacterium]|nr:UvrD-helicase domain-containing protein [Bacteroidales bacterium]
MGNIQFINAGAGSGKTYTLTKLFCKRLAEGAKPSEFVLTTYTKAAADEFRSKIKARLMEEGMNDMLSLVESAQIGTIHSVAQSFIEKYWYLLDMSPALAIKEEDEMKAFRSRVLDTVASEEDLAFFYDYATKLDVKKQVNNASILDPDFWRDMVLELVDKMRLYGFESGLLDSFKQSSVEIVKDVYPAYTMKMDEMKNAAGELLAFFNTLKKTSQKPALEAWSEVFVPFIDEPSWERCLPLLKVMEKTAVWVQTAPQDMFDIVRKYALSHIREQALECVERVFAIAARLLDKISEFKRAEGVLEFSDLEVLFLKLLSYDSVRTDLADSIKYVFVDEFQDVSPIQLKIFQTLSEIVGESCWVGDPKQAIYGFRGSDSSLVNSVITSMKENVEKLEFSHRSLPQLVNASNDIFINSFALLTDSEKLEEKYVKLDPCEKKIAEQAAYGDSYIAQHQWWLSVPTKAGAESSDTKNASKVYPAVATKLWNIFNDKKYKVTDTVDDKPVLRDLRYGDVAILTRSNK